MLIAQELRAEVIRLRALLFRRHPVISPLEHPVSTLPEATRWRSMSWEGTWQFRRLVRQVRYHQYRHLQQLFPRPLHQQQCHHLYNQPQHLMAPPKTPIKRRLLMMKNVMNCNQSDL